MTFSPDSIANRGFEKELKFSSSKSSGPGGQNVNKVNSRVELRFSITDSNYLTAAEKELLFERLSAKINAGGDLIIACQTERTQFANKKKVIEKFFRLLTKALYIQPKRISTKPSKSSVNERLKTKQLTSKKKEYRRTPSDADSASFFNKWQAE